MKLQNIKFGLIQESKTNVLGRTEGKSFDDLVASIKEKGVLVPILLRPIGDRFEIVAGHRRFAAAKEVGGLDEIPAQIVEMTDTEAREAQIVENLQRENIHPLDEGESYRTLIESSRTHKSGKEYTILEVSLKIGKSESYVRTRLALTNLTERSAMALRKNEITLRDAILLARVDDEKIQHEALKYFKDYSWEFESVSEWIRNATYLKAIRNSSEISDVVLAKTEKPSLFGDKSLGIDPVSSGERIAAFIENKIQEYADRGEKMVKISTDYGEPKLKGILGRDAYRTLNSKEDKAIAKEQIHGIVAEGGDLGQIYLITTSSEDLKGNAGGSVYKLSKKEKEDRKKEREKQEKEKQKEINALNTALKKVRWPISEKHLDVLVDLCFRRLGFSYIQPVANRHEIKAVKVKKNGYVTRDLDGPMKKWVDSLDNTGKMRFIFEVILETVNRDKEVLKKF